MRFAFLCLLLVVFAAPSGAVLVSYSENSKLNDVTLLGSHNTYRDKAQFVNLSSALSVVHVIEIDVWNYFGRWVVSHDNPFSSSNNCPKSGLANQPRDQDFRSCIDGLRRWHDADPNHELVIIKLEFKGGLGNAGELDNLVADIAGAGRAARLPESWIVKPSDLQCIDRPLCSKKYDTPEASALAGNWPPMKELRGKFMFFLIPGTVSDSAPRTYAAALRSGSARLMFPAVFADEKTGAADPRLRYFANNPELRPWTVVTDIQAGRLDSGQVPTSVIDTMATNGILISINDTGLNNSDRLLDLSARYRANIVNIDRPQMDFYTGFDRP